MAEHGFRIYVVEAYLNQKKDRDPVEVGIGSRAQAQILDLLDQLHEEDGYFFPPPPSKAGEPERSAESITVGHPVAVGSGLIHAEVAVGVTDSHLWAKAPSGTTRDLTGTSPEAGHYVGLVFADDPSETRFLIITMTIRRKDPVRLLLRRLKDRGQEIKVTARAEEEAARKSAIEAGEKPPPRQKHERLLFDYRQAVDSNYLFDIVKNAKKFGAVFTSKVPYGRSGDMTEVKRTLDIRILDENGVDLGREVGQSWLRRFRQGKAKTHAEGVSELGAILEGQGLLSEGEANIYDEAALAFSGGGGPATTVTVDTLREMFTYPVSDGRPPEYLFYKRANERLSDVAADEEFEFSPIDPQEVESCLEDSTSGLSSKD